MPPARTSHSLALLAAACLVALAPCAYAQQERSVGPTPADEASAAPSTNAESPAIINDWDPARPTPPNYHVQRKKSWELIVGGAIGFTAFYAPLAVLATRPGLPTSLGVPVVGPFILAGQMIGAPTGCTTYCGLEHGVIGFFAVGFISDGLFQIAGLTALTIGVAQGDTTSLRRNDLGLNIHLVPMVSPNQQGLSLMGTF